MVEFYQMKWWGMLLFIFLAPASASAGLVLNEFLPNPASDSNEWVELFNTGPEAVDLSTYSLEDNASHNKPLSSLGSVLAGNFVVYEYTGGDGWLNNSSPGDTLFLKNNADVVNQFAYSVDPGESVTFGRYPDGTGEFIALSQSTRGSANSPPPSPTPTPTPAPTLTPTPTPTPTSTPTPTPTPTTRPTPTPKPSPTPSVSPPSLPPLTVRGGTEEGDIKETLAVSPQVLSASSDRNPTNWWAIILTSAGGVVFLLSIGLIIKGYVHPPVP